MRGTVLKKGFVALLIVLALIVLVSPGIVGRLAEKSMDDSLDRAAAEGEDIVITSQGFDRGWFSSAGQHRIELREGVLRDTLYGVGIAAEPGKIPALLIETRLDHGLIPLASMTREQGSLTPGLGNAISTLSLELADGSRVPLPGTIYSKLGLTGELQSHLILEADSYAAAEGHFDWSAGELLVTASPANNAIDVRGQLASLSVTANGETLSLNAISVAATRQPSPFGFTVGTANASVASLAVDTADATFNTGPLSVESDVGVEGDRISGTTSIRMQNLPSELGTTHIATDIRLEEADGRAFAKLLRTLDAARPAADTTSMAELLSRGFALHIDRFDVSVPQGTITSKFDFVVEETAADAFTVAAALLAVDATADISVPATLMDYAIAMDPRAGAAVGLGYLRKQGDNYEMHAEIRDGVLTINGAPMQLPVGEFR